MHNIIFHALSDDTVSMKPIFFLALGAFFPLGLLSNYNFYSYPKTQFYCLRIVRMAFPHECFDFLFEQFMPNTNFGIKRLNCCRLECQVYSHFYQIKKGMGLVSSHDLQKKGIMEYLILLLECWIKNVG